MDKKFYQQPHSYSVPFDNSENGFDAETTQEAIEEAKMTATGLPRWTLVLQYNGTISNGDFIGYDSLISGEDTPVIIGAQSYFAEFTFSNSRDNADYALEFYKNGTNPGDLFLTVSKTNVQYFTHELITPEFFNLGDIIYIKYVDQGTNASDVVVVLYMRATL